MNIRRGRDNYRSWIIIRSGWKGLNGRLSRRRIRKQMKRRGDSRISKKLGRREDNASRKYPPNSSIQKITLSRSQCNRLRNPKKYKIPTRKRQSLYGHRLSSKPNIMRRRRWTSCLISSKREKLSKSKIMSTMMTSRRYWLNSKAKL